jgi:transmembrane sensor
MPDETRDLLPAVHAPEEDALWGRIARVVAGEAAGEPLPVGESRAVREAERVWAAAGAARQWQGAVEPDAAAAFASVSRRIDRQEQIPLRVVREERVTPLTVAAVERTRADGLRRRRLAGLGVAAAAAAVAVAVGLPGSRKGDSPEPTVAVGSAASMPQSIWLADSTRVVLAANSVLSTTPGYGVRHRDVTLVGEAFVTVAHRAPGSAPFRLTVGGAVIEDIGTAFVVRGERDGTVRVSVTDGAIRLWGVSARDTVELRQRGAAQVDTTGSVRKLPEVDPLEAVAWTQDRFVVRNATLAHVVDAVRSRYGVTLQYDDPAMGARKVTADFGTDGAGTVVATIAATLGLDLERLGAEGYRLRDPARPRAARSAAGN